MSVQITFEPDGGNGLVAEGTYIWEAAKRLGVSVPAECKGRGECDSCAVVIERGAELLSPATSAEEKMLGQDRLERLQGQRLACQAILEKSGELSVRLVPIGEGEQKQSAPGSTLRGLPLKEKVGTLIELQAVTITEALNSVRGGYHALVAKFLNLTPQTTNDAEQTTKEAKQQTRKESSTENGKTAKEPTRDGSA